MDELDLIRLFRRDSKPSPVARSAARERLDAHIADDRAISRSPGQFATWPSMGRALRCVRRARTPRVSLRPPGSRHFRFLDYTVRGAARREVAYTQTIHEPPAYEQLVEPAYQRLLKTKLNESWLESLAAQAARSFTAMNASLETKQRERQHLTERLEVAKTHSKHLPTIKLDITTQLAVALATILGALTAWPFIQALEWPLPVAALMAIALATFEVAIAGLFGLCVHAFVMDESGTSFELSVKQNLLFRACAVLTGGVAFASTVTLAVLRGHGSNQVVWMLLGLGLVAFAAYGGAAINDNRFDQEVKRLSKRLREVNDAVRQLQGAYEATARSTMATARGMCAVAVQIDHRAAAAFVKSWRRHHRERPVPVPSLPRLELPPEADLRQKLLVPMFNVDEHSSDPIVEEVPVSPLRPRRDGVPARARS